VVQTGHKGRSIDIGVEGHIHCLDYDSTTKCLAVGVGEHVFITKDLGDAGAPLTCNNCSHRLMVDLSLDYAAVVSLPMPTNQVEAANNDVRIRPRGAHFMGNGTRLVVSYLNHGVVYVLPDSNDM